MGASFRVREMMPCLIFRRRWCVQHRDPKQRVCGCCSANARPTGYCFLTGRDTPHGAIAHPNELLTTVNCFVFPPGGRSFFFVNAHAPGRNQIPGGRFFFFQKYPRGGNLPRGEDEIFPQRAHQHTHTHKRWTRSTHKRSERRGWEGRIKRHTHGAASPKVVLDPPTPRRGWVRNPEGTRHRRSSCGESLEQVGAARTLMWCSMVVLSNRQGDGWFLFPSHENTFTATIDMMLNARWPYDRSWQLS